MRSLSYGYGLLALVLAVTPSSAAPVVWDEAAARHLLSRVQFGGTAEEAKALAALPLQEAVQKLLADAAQQPTPESPQWVRNTWVNVNRRYADMSAEEYLVVLRRNGSRNTAELNELRAWWLNQMVHSPTPFREQMTLFWHGHFTSATGKVFAIEIG